MKRPAPGGKAITEGDFCEELELYVNEQKETKTKTSKKENCHTLEALQILINRQQVALIQITKSESSRRKRK